MRTGGTAIATEQPTTTALVGATARMVKAVPWNVVLLRGVAMLVPCEAMAELMVSSAKNKTAKAICGEAFVAMVVGNVWISGRPPGTM